MSCTPNTEVIKDAACFPRDRLGEPRGIDRADFDRWLASVKAEALREAAVVVMAGGGVLPTRDGPKTWGTKPCGSPRIGSTSWRTASKPAASTTSRRPRMPEHVPDTWLGFGLHLMRTRPQGVPVEQIADDVTLFLMHVHDRQENNR